MRFAKSIGVTASVCAAILLAAGAVTAQDGESDQDAEMAAYLELAKPGQHHGHLAETVGNWDTQNKFWMAPDQPPMEVSGEASLEMLMGGRFLSEVTTAEMMGAPWEGRGVFGYDNTEKRHVATWFDSFGTMIMHFVGDGTCKGDCHVVSMTSDYTDPMTNQTKTMKTVTTVVDADNRLLEMYDVDGEGNATKTAEVRYTRRKS